MTTKHVVVVTSEQPFPGNTFSPVLHRALFPIFPPALWHIWRSHPRTPCLPPAITASQQSGCLKTSSSSATPCFFLSVGIPVPKGLSVVQRGLHPSFKVETPLLGPQLGERAPACSWPPACIWKSVLAPPYAPLHDALQEQHLACQTSPKSPSRHRPRTVCGCWCAETRPCPMSIAARGNRGSGLGCESHSWVMCR